MKARRLFWTADSPNIMLFFYESHKLRNCPVLPSAFIYLFIYFLYLCACLLPASSGSVYQWGEKVCTTLLAAVLAVESLHKTEICSGSGQSHDQIKPSQVSSREPIHSHHKNGSLFVFSVHQSIVGHLAHLRYWDILLLSINPTHISFFVLFNSASGLLLECFMVHHVRFISKNKIAKCTLYLLVLRRDLLPVKKSYVHWGVLHPDSF